MTTQTFEIPAFVQKRVQRRADSEARIGHGQCIYGCRAEAHLYPGGTFCDEHAPGINPTPDPTLTLAGLRLAAGLREDATFLPSHTAIDQKAIDSGKRASGERRRAAHDDPAPSLTDRFRTFHEANGHVYARLVELVEEHVARGARRLSIGAMFEELRGRVETNGARFQLDNSLRAPYVRLLIDEHPHLDGLFELRTRRSA